MQRYFGADDALAIASLVCKVPDCIINTSKLIVRRPHLLHSAVLCFTEQKLESVDPSLS